MSPNNQLFVIIVDMYDPRRTLSLTLSGVSTATALFLVATSRAYAQTITWSGVCVGTSENAEGVATIQGLECLIANIFIVALTVIGLTTFVMFIVASFRWMLSGSDSKGMQSARSTMTFAILGLVLALSSFMVVRLIASFTGVNVITRFVIPTSEL